MRLIVHLNCKKNGPLKDANVVMIISSQSLTCLEEWNCSKDEPKNEVRDIFYLQR